MSALMGVSPLLLLVAAGLAIMLVDAFTDERAELAVVTAAALFVVAGLAATMLLGEVPPAPEVVTRYLAVDRFGLFFDVVICVGAGLSALLAGGYLREHGFERGEFSVQKDRHQYSIIEIICSNVKISTIHIKGTKQRWIFSKTSGGF